MHFVFCTYLPDYCVPWGSAPISEFYPLWRGDYVVYVAM